jgi:isopenicillin N synthase-like dioxygenase
MCSQSYHASSITINRADNFKKEWRQLRRPLFDALSSEILNSDVTLTGTPALDYESMALHYYVPQMMDRENDYSPPHMDGGTLTILVRGNEDYDGLEVADLESTEKLDGEGIRLEASFLSVPAAADEVIVFFGTRMQRLLGRDKARACVHRVRAPAQMNRQRAAEERFSFAIFCAPPVI